MMIVSETSVAYLISARKFMSHDLKSEDKPIRWCLVSVN